MIEGVVNHIAAEIINKFSGGKYKREVDVFFVVQKSNGEIKLSIRIPDEVMQAVEDCVRTGQIEMIPESILMNAFSPKDDDKFTMMSASPDLRIVDDSVSLGTVISKIVFKYLLKAFREARLADTEEE